MNNKIEEKVAQSILERGAEYQLDYKKSITIQPLKFGTTLAICERLCQANLTLQIIEEGENNLPEFLVKHADSMLAVIAIAITNNKDGLCKKLRIRKRISFLQKNLSMFQLYELFIYIMNLSGMQAFMNTIRLAFSMKAMNLSPKAIQGS